MSKLVPKEKQLATLIELCNLIGKPSLARDLAAASEMSAIAGRRIAVAGLVKRGKSTFVNRIIGENLSPVNLLPETSSVLCFQRGNSAQAHGIAFDGSSLKLSIKPRKFSSDVSRDARHPILAASYQGFINLPDNFCLVDTPGAHETDVTENSMVESGMPSSLFHLCGGFIVVMGVPGLSGTDIKLLETINKAAGELPVRVLLKGLDSGISQNELLEYSKEVLAEIQNEVFIVSDENFDDARRMLDSFNISYFDTKSDAQEVSELVTGLILKNIHDVFDSRDEMNELVVSKKFVKCLPTDIAERVKFFAPGARKKREKAAKRAEIKKFESELYKWKANDRELWHNIGLCDNLVRQAEYELRKHKHAPLTGFLFDVFATNAAKNRFQAEENALTFKLNTASINAKNARDLYANHQKLKPNRPLH